ncbi:porin [Burkholderia sp. S171]|uniref:porin n=1 Tax=Burkholderia sp. S171 TaxID=1641860 RepID=UPI0020B11BAB|nr:porin [Burkholderia sp. S171]
MSARIDAGTYGSFKMGRQYDSVVDYLAPTTANGNWAGYLFAHPYDNDNTDNSWRVSNSVKYSSGNYGGFQFGGLYGFSNAPGQIANNRLVSAGASYTNGPVYIGAAYMNINNVGIGSSGAVAANDASFFAEHQRTFGAGINYTLDKAVLGFVYTHSAIDNPTGNGYLTPSAFPTGISVSSIKFDNFELNAKYSFTPSFFVGGMYTFSSGKYEGSNGTASPKWHQFGLMADYNISKRTDIYVQGVYELVADGGTGTALDKAYINGTANSSSTTRQLAARVALRHFF